MDTLFMFIFSGLQRPGFTQDMSLDSSDDEQEIFIPSANWFQNSLSRRLGDWEKHTKVCMM